MKRHPSYRRVGRGIEKRWEYYGVERCDACKTLGYVCKVCQKTYSVSTAMDEHKFCSMYCEDRFKI